MPSGNHGRIQFLLPMVSTVEEVAEFRRFLELCAQELGLPDHATPVGAMIETPAAAATSEALGEVSDFLAIGSNDLVQYTTAAERDNEHVAHLYLPFHPGVLRMLSLAVEGAERAGVSISVCGEIAAQPEGQVALLGLGVRRLSLHPARIPQARGLIQSLNCNRLRAAAEEWLVCATSEQVEDQLRQEVAKVTSTEVH